MTRRNDDQSCTPRSTLEPVDCATYAIAQTRMTAAILTVMRSHQSGIRECKARLVSERPNQNAISNLSAEFRDMDTLRILQEMVAVGT